MKFYYDTEFIEGTQKKLFGHTPPTIDLISIGIVAENGNSCYYISKEFNVKEAWNRFQLDSNQQKVYWIRENVLFPIFHDLYKLHFDVKYDLEFGNYGNFIGYLERLSASKLMSQYRLFKYLLNEYGYTRSEIAFEVACFIANPDCQNLEIHTLEDASRKILSGPTPELVGYYSAFDHVVFAWLFGKMIDMPEGLPWYSSDLKLDLDRLCADIAKSGSEKDPKVILKKLKSHDRYPENNGEHNALEDAFWNKNLDSFIKYQYKQLELLYS